MATVITKFGPKDHGRAMSLEDFLASSGEPGYKYELIDGRVYVSPAADQPHDSLDTWLFRVLLDYSRAHPEVVNYVSPSARVFVHGRRAATCPQPDLAAYHDFPHHLPLRQRRWQDLSPLLVVEIISEDTAEKDLERNVELYLEVPSIREYWVIDPRSDPDRPTLRVYRRRGARWQKPIEVAYGETYASPRLLPGFALLVDPRSGV